MEVYTNFKAIWMPLEEKRLILNKKIPPVWRYLVYLWQGRKDSNPRMPESESGALTNLATPLHRENMIIFEKTVSAKQADTVS